MDEKNCSEEQIIHIYWVSIRQLEGREEAAMRLLTGQRRTQAEQAADGQVRRQKIAAGFLMKKYLGISGDDEISPGRFGKPEKKKGGEFFNLSHGGEYVALAVGQTELGLDIEAIWEDVPELPECIFTRRELDWLRDNPGGESATKLWTRLESLLKADGRGFEWFEREVSAIGDTGQWHIETVVKNGHVISCAARKPFKLCIAQPETLGEI